MTAEEKQGFLDQLQRYTVADWQPFFALVAELESNLPKDQHALASKLYSVIYHQPDIVIRFDWPDWAEGRAILTSKQPDFSPYDLLTLCMLLTTIVRAERFSEGFLNQCYQRGLLLDLLRAIRQRVAQSNPTT